MKSICALLLFIVAAVASAQSVFNCSTFNSSSSGSCSVAPYYDNTNGFATTQQFWIRSNCQSSTSPFCLSGTDAAFVPAGATHNGFGMAYSVGKVNVQAFTDTFTFVPNGWNFSLVLQNDNTHSGYEGAAFSSGASCEAGFYQDDGTDPTPNYLFALDFDNSGYIGSSYSYSTVQMYEMHESPCQPNDGGIHYWGTTKISTSPVPMSSPVGSQYTTTGDTYSATVTYDGSTLTLNMYDVTASGSCPGASCFTHTWSNVSIPSIVGGTTAWLGFTSAVGSGSPQEPSQAPIYVDSWSYVVNTPTGTPTYTAWNAGSTYNNGTVSAASPMYSLAPGTYSGSQTVSLSSSTGSSNICYVLSGTVPTLYPQVDNNGGCSAGTLYSGPISVSATATLYAMAGTPWGTGPPSTLVSGAYTINPVQYYMSPTGSDSNNGTSPSTPWASPNHALTCGQTILAAVGTYPATNFYTGKWGSVSCPAANNVAWLQCATFDGCKINTSTAQGIYVSSSFWGVTGFEVTSTATFGTCFLVQSAINHVIFANDVANGCTQGGFSMNHGDYMIEAGDIAYNTALGSSSCTSGFNIWEPAQSDSVAGTHMYVASNYAWDNVEPNPCGGTAPTDGEGLIFDTFNNTTYTAQAVAYNNLFVSNGGRGIEANFTGAPKFVIEYNTTYGNNNQVGQAFPSGNGEIEVENDGVSESTGSIIVQHNLAMTSQATTGGSAIYAGVIQSSSDVTFSSNWLYSAAGNTTLGSGFGSNTTGTNPAFTSTTIPGAPSCSGTANTAACAATLIANFTPTAGGSTAFGRQAISNTSVTDPLFPTWLCNSGVLITGFPSGILTPGCGTGGPTLLSIAVTGSGAIVNGTTTQLVATGTYNTGGPQVLTTVAAWASGNTGVCTIGLNTGFVTAVSPGLCNITATYSSITSTPLFPITVSVAPGNVVLQGITVSTGNIH